MESFHRSRLPMPSPESSLNRRCIVIGAGLSGLAAAEVMINEGWHTTLVDAAGRAGGVIETIRDDGWLVERSADSFLTARPEALETTKQLGLEAQILPLQAKARRALVLRRSRLHAVPAGFRLMAPGRLLSLLRSPLLSPLGKLRVLLERFVPASQTSDESLEAFATRRLGREAFERLVQPLCSGIWTADPAKLSMAAALPDFLAMEKTSGSLRAGEKKRLRTADRNEAAAGARYGHFVTLATGLDTLPTRWIAHLRTRGLTTLQGRVSRIERTQTFRVELDPSPAADAGFNAVPASTLEADAVLVTAPAPRAADMLRTVSPALAAELAGITYAGSAVVSLGYPREAVAHPLDAAGLVIPRQERRQILAVSFSSSKFPGRTPAGHVLMRVFLGGALDPAAASLDDSTLLTRATREVGQLLGASGSPSFARVERWEGSMPQYHLGHMERVARIHQLVADIPGCGLAGAALEGVGIPQVIASGRAAARQAMATSSSCRPSLEQPLPSSSSSS
jgi:oxygen-dependent protoporphyrinogen oxidase